ncbi:MAG: hypothetical protein COV74_04945 [Candidatus Omnitrophica bacterium CG11_big_fil_rev_8_21_14_0_20_45_26]|uniref:BsaWI restriction endonuclease type 2 domain-containing protein n=1 Tax=Candidatus Abzuiibacterium crystallinum TaxID=1974748 RepID=A0A2H0LPP9_9BACT|nr:MAG: hypothetical protein COV74_04945 [Candidatus Omnitrophica bacterium CG11_big_fil_rev_8_21_14_0_20_45_26]
MVRSAVLNRSQENEFKDVINKFFDNKLKSALKKPNNPLEVGNNIAMILKKSDKEVVKIVAPRAVRKWASLETRAKWQKILADPRMLMELRLIGKSIANTMRPLAGNKFTLWIAKILNTYLEDARLPLKAITKGKIKTVLNKSFLVKIRGQKQARDYKPDIDIILVRSDLNDKPVAIISTKTTSRERMTQTISWSRFLKSSPMKKLKIYLVIAWDVFEDGANKERAQELDGVYVCNKEVNEYGKIKRFSKIGQELKRLCH